MLSVDCTSLAALGVKCGKINCNHNTTNSSGELHWQLAATTRIETTRLQDSTQQGPDRSAATSNELPEPAGIGTGALPKE